MTALNLYKIFTILLLCMIGIPKARANINEERVRLGMSVNPAKGGSHSLNIEVAPIFSNSSSLGLELYSLKLAAFRGMIWQYPANLSGFYGGPKIITSLTPEIDLEPGVEIGWLYRFSTRIDLGLGMDFIFADVIGGTLKFSGGYLF